MTPSGTWMPTKRTTGPLQARCRVIIGLGNLHAAMHIQHTYVVARCVRVGDAPVGTAHTALFFTAMSWGSAGLLVGAYI
eukprot:1188329-Prorocentrum_minimum.AAC.3